MATIRQQLRDNAVALVSLLVALSALGYNTWRNEQTEANRNVRAAGFEMIRELGSLQQVVFYSHFAAGDERGDSRMGWADVLTIGDLARVMPEDVAGSADRLRETWQRDFAALGADEVAHVRIDGAIDDLRARTLETLRRLD